MALSTPGRKAKYMYRIRIEDPEDAMKLAGDIAKTIGDYPCGQDITKSDLECIRRYANAIARWASQEGERP